MNRPLTSRAQRQDVADAVTAGVMYGALFLVILKTRRVAEKVVA